MEHQNAKIPEHLQTEWQQASERLSEASINLNEAQKEYNAAILARIALSEALRQYEQQ